VTGAAPKDAGDVLDRGGALSPHGQPMETGASEGAPPTTSVPRSGNAKGKQPKDERPAIIWHTAADLATPLEETKWVVEGLYLAPGRPHMIAGYGFSGKTLAAQSLALSVASGKDVWGFFSVEPGTVRHLDYEMGYQATKRRYQRLARGMDLDLASLGDRLQVTNYPRVYLDDPDAEDAYAEACDGADLVILDALCGATPATDENASMVRARLDILARISEQTGSTFVIIHHAGKSRTSDSRQTGRGSSAIFDACGTQLVMTASGNTTPKKVEMTKTAGDAIGEPLDPFFLLVEDVFSNAINVGLRILYRKADEVEDSGPEADALERDVTKIIGIIEADPGCSQRTIRSKARMKNERLQQLLVRLVDEERVIRTKSGNAYCYTVPEEPDELWEHPL